MWERDLVLVQCSGGVVIIAGRGKEEEMVEKRKDEEVGVAYAACACCKVRPMTVQN